MRTAVTGAGGFLGLNLVRRLITAGHEVLAIDRAFSARSSNVLTGQSGLELATIDVLDQSELTDKIAAYKPDALFHGATLTADLSREKQAFSDVLAVNVVGTANTLEAARQAGVLRVVVASSSAVYGEAVFEGPARESDPTRPATLYGITKLAAEQAALRFGSIHGMDVRVTRIAAVFGPYEYRSGARDVMSPLYQITEKALAGEDIILPHRGARDWIGASRVANVIACLLEHPQLHHAIYNVAASTVWHPKLFCEHLGRAMNARFRIDNDPANINFRDDLSRQRLALDTARIRAEMVEGILGTPDEDCAEYVEWIRGNPGWFVAPR